MTRLRRAWIAMAVAMIGAVSVGGCGTSAARTAGGSVSPGPARPTASPTIRPIQPSALPGNDRYVSAIRAANEAGLQVWVETDLVKAWQAGPPAYDANMARVLALAQLPGVVGVKIADELGYDDGFDRDPSGMHQFLAATAARLHAVVPRTLILADLVVPDLGCAPGDSSLASLSRTCQAANDAKHPALSLDEVDRTLAGGWIDVVDMSTGLLSGSEYGSWGLSQDGAQTAAWSEVNRRGWTKLARLNARKALAHPGAFAGTTADADAAVTTYVNIPRRLGAQAVDIWTWRQQYQGQTYRLMDPGLRSNALWAALRRQRADGVQLLTHFTPSQVETTVRGDLDTIAEVFTGVFVAAGTG